MPWSKNTITMLSPPPGNLERKELPDQELELTRLDLEVSSDSANDPNQSTGKVVRWLKQATSITAAGTTSAVKILRYARVFATAVVGFVRFIKDLI